MLNHPVVDEGEWLAARKALLEEEKALTRRRDEVLAKLRALPWVKVEKEYVFDSTTGPTTLADLFRGRSQLIVQHFMLGPGWKEGCVGCSFKADHVDAARQHFENHDVAFAAVSRAPIEEIQAFQERMGWTFSWVSSARNDFNYDYHVSFRPEDLARNKSYYNFRENDFAAEELSGNSVFYKDESGAIYHTYSAYGRGDELLVGAYMYLDMTPKGRNETVRGNLTDWVRHHDRYGAGGHVAPTGRYVAPETLSCECEHSR
ncbi:MAG TPA: thioredoxin family protein [Bryobacteraceae bacterium]|jgi:predicted dithiol-disulfide oxidoreductase (DUF899 family)|nr:thioredoxin family protein [Bryobacteraceae bacterium]